MDADNQNLAQQVRADLGPLAAALTKRRDPIIDQVIFHIKLGVVIVHAISKQGIHVRQAIGVWTMRTTPTEFLEAALVRKLSARIMVESYRGELRIPRVGMA